MSSTRPLSEFETIFWKMSDASSLNFTMVLGISGPLNELVLRSALAAVQKKYPLLQVRIEVTSKGPVFRRENVPEIPVMIEDSPESLEITDLLEEELEVTVPWKAGPMVRCTWVRHANQFHHLLVTFHHIIGDAISGVNFLRDLLSVMSEASDSGSTSVQTLDSESNQDLPLSVDQRFPKPARGWRGVSCMIRTIGHFVRQDRRLGEAVVIPGDVRADASSERIHVLSQEFDETYTLHLREQAKKEKTTVHCVLSAAICLTMAEVIGGGEPVSIKHRSPINIRRDLEPPVGDEVGLFASILFFRDRLVGKENFWEVARAIQAQHEEQRRKLMPLASLRLTSLLYRAVGGKKRTGHELGEAWRTKSPGTCGLTNIGIVDLPKYSGPFTVEGLHFAVSTASLVNFTSTAATYDGRLTWNFLCPCRVFERSNALQLVDKIVARLNEALELQPVSGSV